MTLVKTAFFLLKRLKFQEEATTKNVSQPKIRKHVALKLLCTQDQSKFCAIKKKKRFGNFCEITPKIYLRSHHIINMYG